MAGMASVGRRMVELIAVIAFTQQTAFQDRFGQFLDEQRDAVGACQDFIDDGFRESLACWSHVE